MSYFVPKCEMPTTEEELIGILQRLEKYGSTVCSNRLVKTFKNYDNIVRYFREYGYIITIRKTYYGSNLIKLEGGYLYD